MYQYCCFVLGLAKLTAKGKGREHGKTKAWRDWREDYQAWHTKHALTLHSRSFQLMPGWMSGWYASSNLLLTHSSTKELFCGSSKSWGESRPQRKLKRHLMARQMDCKIKIKWSQHEIKMHHIQYILNKHFWSYFGNILVTFSCRMSHRSHDSTV